MCVIEIYNAKAIKFKLTCVKSKFQFIPKCPAKGKRVKKLKQQYFWTYVCICTYMCIL